MIPSRLYKKGRFPSRFYNMLYNRTGFTVGYTKVADSLSGYREADPQLVIQNGVIHSQVIESTSLPVGYKTAGFPVGYVEERFSNLIST